MVARTRRYGGRARRALLLAAVAVASTTARSDSGADRQAEMFRFAAEMARNGDWREALYRWERMLAGDPDNPRVLNNLAVAREALGDAEQADEIYRKALALSGNDPRIADNAERAAFQRRSESPAPGSEATGDRSAPRPGPRDGKSRGGAVQVAVKLPVSPRLQVANAESMLVASFLGPETDLFDTGRELVRFLRAEFRKKTELAVRDVTPPPAVPEQPIEDFVLNAEFWKHLGKTYDADLVVSGSLDFTRRDASGFGEVDMISPTTGQKVRRTQFIEQEEFAFDVDLMFFDGRSGALLFRDRLRRTALFRGSSNDPITAFHEIAESFAADVLSVVSPRTREDTRYIFKS